MIPLLFLLERNRRIGEVYILFNHFSLQIPISHPKNRLVDNIKSSPMWDSQYGAFLGFTILDQIKISSIESNTLLDFMGFDNKLDSVRFYLKTNWQ